MSSKFDNHIKESLENFSSDYNPADWTALEGRLDKVSAGKSSSIAKSLLIAASIIGVAAVIYYLSSSETPKKAVVENVVIEKANEASAEINKVVATNSVKEDFVQEKPNMSAPQKGDLEKNSSAGAVQEVKEEPNRKTNPEENIQNGLWKDDAVVEVPKQNQSETVPAAPVLNASFSASKANICEGEEVVFTVPNNNISSTYKWYFGDGTSSTEVSPKHVFAEAGSYKVRLIVTSTIDRKKAEERNTVEVNPAPSLRMNYAASEENNLKVNFESDADNLVEWKWDFGDKTKSTLPNPTHSYVKHGAYNVILSVKNSKGCAAVATQELNLKDEINLLAPNAFSPDGNGINDTWMPVGLKNGNYRFVLLIENAAGAEVFRTSDKNQAWDGQNTQPGETFLWKVQIKDGKGKESIQQGLITISE